MNNLAKVLIAWLQHLVCNNIFQGKEQVVIVENLENCSRKNRGF